MSKVSVRVLQECVLNDPDHRALPESKPGDVVTIAGGWYAESVRDSGLVEILDDVRPEVATFIEQSLNDNPELWQSLADADKVSLSDLKALDEESEPTSIADELKESPNRRGRRSTGRL